MKKIIILATLAFSFQALASQGTFNDTCRTIYGDATQELVSSVEKFQANNISDIELSLDAATVSTELVGIRSSCALIEDPKNHDAVASYKKLYREIRGKIKTLSLIIGTQEEVDMSFLDLTLLKAKLKILDYKYDRK
jgi:hypothetical protein